MTRLVCKALMMAISVFATCANAAPMAYSVNSDSANFTTEDSLYLIDLSTGVDQRIGKLVSIPSIYDHYDTEGLAFLPNPEDGLWGIDDATRTLFPINTATGAISYSKIISLTNIFPAGGNNDFGMTISCDNSLYVTSVVTGMLYHIDLDSGDTEVIGALGVNISAIAAIGIPAQLYGLGNGLDKNGNEDAPYLYSIDIETGAAAAVGGPLGADAYNQAGLAFDELGTLWAITDRRGINKSKDGLPSQVLTIDISTGQSTLVSTTSEVGFESLAIATPDACRPVDPPSVPASDPPSVSVPALHPVSRLLAIFVLLLTGIFILRRRFS